ncbi:phosphatase PAP2 family protein [Paenibacillus thalictri]|uniref:Phosphatase PAP2 family protein n=1 Tax=Paenibacillus thalictri TaxID=2527873 RepID=A0A4Q9DK68_9BACL|nr:phosphatase PAP2 family protein [Paenibacillus thalictri]TBL72452.1 phosphatase PAP2 family protein [Paenibacillus thalictri]
MKLNGRLAAAFIVSLLCAAGFGLIALFVSSKQIAAFDQTLVSLVQGMETPALTQIMKCFTTIGSGKYSSILALAIVLFLYFVLHHRKELILFVWVTGGTWLLNEGLKAVFQRARPDIHRIVQATGYSFPSGHSMAAFSLYGVFAFLLWRHIPSALGRIVLIALSGILILMIGISRIYLGVHYPSDVLGGFLASGCWVFLSVWIFRRYIQKGRQRRREIYKRSN